MNTPLTHRLAAAASSMAIPFRRFPAVVANAWQPVPVTLLTQSDTVSVH
jgi:hypothetical protein